MHGSCPGTSALCARREPGTEPTVPRSCTNVGPHASTDRVAVAVGLVRVGDERAVVDARRGSVSASLSPRVARQTLTSAGDAELPSAGLGDAGIAGGAGEIRVVERAARSGSCSRLNTSWPRAVRRPSVRSASWRTGMRSAGRSGPCRRRRTAAQVRGSKSLARMDQRVVPVRRRRSDRRPTVLGIGPAGEQRHAVAPSAAIPIRAAWPAPSEAPATTVSRPVRPARPLASPELRPPSAA